MRLRCGIFRFTFTPSFARRTAWLEPHKRGRERELGTSMKRLTMRDFMMHWGMRYVSLESDTARGIWQRLEPSDVTRIQRLLAEKGDRFSGFCVRAPMKWEKEPVTILFASPKYTDGDQLFSDDEYEELWLRGGILDLEEREAASGARTLVTELEKRAPSTLTTEI